MTRSTILYHPSILSDKRAVIKKANDLINESQESKLEDAARLLVLNKECEAKLVELVGCNEEHACFTSMIQEKLTYEMFYKCSAMYLNLFII